MALPNVTGFLKRERALLNARTTNEKYMAIHKQWKDGELPGKALITELQKDIKLLEKDAEEIKADDEKRLPKINYGSAYPPTIETDIEFMEKIINRLQAFNYELEQENTVKNTSDSLPPQAPETDEKMTAYLKGEGYIAKEKSKNGKYDLSDNAQTTIHRFMLSNYQEYEDWNFLTVYLDRYTNHNCTIESLKRYVRDCKKIVPAQLKYQETFESLQKSI